ncbi:hypothetical protein JKP88DRAFT_348237 [Tribonema minus]|uniref:Uncharacterized protein n=1 Tax=Tribonema minus TaxID=303371 RepID=A0A835Z4T4_9STRA|nr:hypothetical protein JKP88DRAFT_348237 [Tribonema minus]
MVHGLLEATGYLCPSRTVSLPYEPAGCSASAAVFWSTVGLGSFLCGAARAVTERYAAFAARALRACFDEPDTQRYAACAARALRPCFDEPDTQKLAGAARALRACFDEPDTQVVHAYLQLGLLEGMLGHYAKARRYVHFSQTLYAGLQAQGQPGSAWDSNEGGMLSSLIASFGPRILDTSESEQVPPDNPESLDVPGMALAAKRGKVSRPFDALRIMLGVRGKVSRPFDVLRIMLGVALEPASPTHVVQQNVQHLVDAWDAAGVIMTCTTLSGCIAARAPQLLLRGSTLLMQERVEEGLADIEQGLALAVQQPNLIRFSLWWHAIHCGVIGLAHHGRIGAYVRTKAVYDAYTFPGTQLPDMPTYLADDHSICGPGHYCIAYRICGPGHYCIAYRVCGGPGHYCIAYRQFLERRCPTVHTRARARHGSLDKSQDESLDKSQDGSRDSSDATNSLTDLDEMDTDGLLPMDMEASEADLDSLQDVDHAARELVARDRRSQDPASHLGSAYDMPAAAAEVADVRSSMVSSPSLARTHHQIPATAASTRSVSFAHVSAITPAAKMPKRVGFNQSVYVLLIPSYQDLGERERADRWWSARELWQFRCSYYQHLVTETQGAAVQC